MERELGFTLFTKNHFGSELTKSGRTLLPRIQQILKNLRKHQVDLGLISRPDKQENPGIKFLPLVEVKKHRPKQALSQI